MSIQTLGFSNCRSDSRSFKYSFAPGSGFDFTVRAEAKASEIFLQRKFDFFQFSSTSINLRADTLFGCRCTSQE